MPRLAMRQIFLESPAEEESGDIQPAIETHLFTADGFVPNNPKLPLILYRQALPLDAGGDDPETAFEALFEAHGWTKAWVNGIYDYHHYHSTAHEVLGIARGSATVQFGGPEGLAVEMVAGDAVAIPAGVGHCLLSGEDVVVVGAYPEGQDWDLCRATNADCAKALENIPWVPLPRLDPVLGASGPVKICWAG
jgi:uncharacterized protein YjlB